MNNDEARHYLDTVRRVLNRNGLSPLDADIFNSLFSDNSDEQKEGVTPQIQLLRYLERLDAYFSFFSEARFDRELSMLNQLCDGAVEQVNLNLDQRLMAQFRRLEERQSLGILRKSFDPTQILEAVTSIRKRLFDGNDDEPILKKNRPRPGGV